MKKNNFIALLLLFFIPKSLFAMEDYSTTLAHLKENIQTLPNSNSLLRLLNNNDPIVSFLQKKGAEIGKINNYGIELLRIAMNDGSLKDTLDFMSKIILQDCIKYIEALDIIDINTPDIHKKTLLIHAIKENNKKILTVLLKKGASIQIYDAKQRNALHCAASKNPLLIKTILKNFIIPNFNEESNIRQQKLNYLKNEILSHKDLHGKKPYEYENAHLNKHPEMQSLLNPENIKMLKAYLK